MTVSIEFTPTVEARALCPVVPMAARDFPSIFRDFGPFVWRVLGRFGVPSAELPDVCQETFIVIHRKLDDFRSESSLRTWIFGICYRTASDYRRRAHVRHERVVETLPEPTVDESQHATAEARQALARLDAALRELDDESAPSSSPTSSKSSPCKRQRSPRVVRSRRPMRDSTLHANTSRLPLDGEGARHDSEPRP
jgi:RNA polymerase sigma factor (sigma-70 family)